MKLLIRGGSIAAGHGVIRSYSDILTQSLLERGIAVVNRSKYQETTFDGIATFKEDIDIYKPDILLIQFGVDDAFQCVYRSEFQENVVQIIRRARARFNPRIVLATCHTFDNPKDMDAVSIFYRSLAITASDLGCELIPVHRYWVSYLEEHHLCNKDLVQTDSRYPNERGHEVIAEAMTNWLSKILDRL
jgi:lysophospholipase L1-like esterase